MLTFSLYLSLIVLLHFIRNSFIRNLYWDKRPRNLLYWMEPQRLKNFQCFISFSYFNFQDTVSDFDKNMLYFQDTVSDFDKNVFVRMKRSKQLLFR